MNDEHASAVPAISTPADAELERHLEQLFRHAGEHAPARQLRQAVLRHRRLQRGAAAVTANKGGADHA